MKMVIMVKAGSIPAMTSIKLKNITIMKTQVNVQSNANQSAKDLLNQALEMIKNKTGFVRVNGNFQCIEKLVANIRHNEYASDIYLANHQGGAEAYFCNGQFWSTTTKTLVTLK